MRDLTGKVVRGRYRVLRLIGEGAMGSVYLVRTIDASRATYALKTLKSELTGDPTFAARFEIECNILEQLRHPNIVQAHDHFRWEGCYFLVLSYVDGRSLADIIDAEGALPKERALSIVKDVLAALDHAHQKWFIHRDVKPSNILIDGREHPLLCDFGIARPMGGRRLTMAGTTLGTPEYMSPEQIQGLQALNHRTDVYSAGVVLFEMLTGRVPFGGDAKMSDYEVRRQHIEDPVPDPRSIDPSIDEALSRIVLKALRKDPARRYSGCGEFRSAIERYEHGAEPVSLLPPVEDAPPPLATRASHRYQVYVHPTLAPAAVREGFCWPALFGHIVWMLRQQLYTHALVWAAAYVGLFLFVSLAGAGAGSDAGLTLLSLLLLGGIFFLWLWPGVRGNEWRAGELALRGYRLKATVSAATAELAVLSARRNG